MTEWEHLRDVINNGAQAMLSYRTFCAEDEKTIAAERDRALAFIDKLEAAVKLTQTWIEGFNAHRDRKTRAVFDAIKEVQP